MENLIVSILTLILVAMLFAFPFMWLWNWIVPIFWTATPILTYWQAFGTYMLLYIVGSVFKSISK